MTRWQFWLGGPQAFDGISLWYTIEDYRTIYGCLLAESVGIEIPKETFNGSEPLISQYVEEGRGYNDTAILPLEIDE